MDARHLPLYPARATSNKSPVVRHLSNPRQADVFRPEAVVKRILSHPALAPFVYGAFAVWQMWPAIADFGGTVPGTAHSDLWNSLWSFWLAAQSLPQGLPPWQVPLLDHPTGGSLMVADIPGAVLLAGPVRWWGVTEAYSLLVVGRMVAVAWSTHLLARELCGPKVLWSPYVAGVAALTAPVLVSGIHNGTSEAFALAPAVVATWLVARAVRAPGWGAWALAGVGLTLATAASGYSAVVAFLYAGAVAVFSQSSAPLWKRVMPVLAGLPGAIAVSAWVVRGATAPGNLVGIKHPAELAGVRRGSGPADIWAYVRGFDYRSPDFRQISRYGEDFVHCPYLGWSLLALTVWGLRTAEDRRAMRPYWIAGLVGAVLSLGPVLVHNGHAWIFWDERVVPLPYLLLERLPGTSSLSLLWRLSHAPALLVALGAAWALRRSKAAWALVAALVVAAEARFVAPTADLPAFTETRVHAAIEDLADLPAGAVIHHPVAGGQPYLYGQTVHQHAIAGTLNFPNNGAGRALWEELRRTVGTPPDIARKRVRTKAQQLGIRYLLIHQVTDARPDMADEAAEWALALFPPAASDGPRATTGPHSVPVFLVSFY